MRHVKVYIDAANSELSSFENLVLTKLKIFLINEVDGVTVGRTGRGRPGAHWRADQILDHLYTVHAGLYVGAFVSAVLKGQEDYRQYTTKHSPLFAKIAIIIIIYV